VDTSPLRTQLEFANFTSPARNLYGFVGLVSIKPSLIMKCHREYEMKNEICFRGIDIKPLARQAMFSLRVVKTFLQITRYILARNDKIIENDKLTRVSGLQRFQARFDIVSYANLHWSNETFAVLMADDIYVPIPTFAHANPCASSPVSEPRGPAKTRVAKQYGQSVVHRGVTSHPSSTNSCALSAWI
jgi:hypothetical protein